MKKTSTNKNYKKKSNSGNLKSAEYCVTYVSAILSMQHSILSRIKARLSALITMAHIPMSLCGVVLFLSKKWEWFQALTCKP
jgi:hypothetical protein